MSDYASAMPGRMLTRGDHVRYCARFVRSMGGVGDKLEYTGTVTDLVDVKGWPIAHVQWCDALGRATGSSTVYTGNLVHQDDVARDARLVEAQHVRGVQVGKGNPHTVYDL